MASTCGMSSTLSRVKTPLSDILYVSGYSARLLKNLEYNRFGRMSSSRNFPISLLNMLFAEQCG